MHFLLLLLLARSIPSFQSILTKFKIYKTYLPETRNYSKFTRPICQKQQTNLYQFQKDCHKDQLEFACPQFFKHICLNILSNSK